MLQHSAICILLPLPHLTPRVYIDQSGSTKILGSVSGGWSTEIEEGRVSLGTVLVDAVFCSECKAEHDATVIRRRPMQSEVELSLQKKGENKTVEGGRGNSPRRRDRKWRSVQEAVNERGQREVSCRSC